MKIVCPAIVLILNPGGIPVTVGVTMFILSIGDLSEKFMDFTFDMYFRQVNTIAENLRHIPSQPKS